MPITYTLAQLITAYTNANDGVAPSGADADALARFASPANQVPEGAVIGYIVNSAQDDVEVAVQAYQFFTGRTPTKAGLDYLVNSPLNPADLNDAYYAQFNLENRYINFVANLGLKGEGAGGFGGTYGAMDFQSFVASVYERIIGSAYAVAGKIDPSAAIADVISRQAAFVAIARDRGLIDATSTAGQVDLAVKAAVVGYLMAEGVKADVGVYAAGANNLVNAMIGGAAQHNVDLLTVYSPLGPGLVVYHPGVQSAVADMQPGAIPAAIGHAEPSATDPLALF